MKNVITLTLTSLEHLESLADVNDTDLDDEVVDFVDELAELGESYGVAIESLEKDEGSGVLRAAVEYETMEGLRAWMLEADPDLDPSDLDDILEEAAA